MCHPAPRRFLSLRSPVMFTNSKAAALNVQELRELSWAGDRYSACSSPVAMFCSWSGASVLVQGWLDVVHT